VLASLDVGLLINNVGLSYDHCEYFEQLSDEDIRSMVEVNITSINKASNRFASNYRRLQYAYCMIWLPSTSSA